MNETRAKILTVRTYSTEEEYGETVWLRIHLTKGLVESVRYRVHLAIRLKQEEAGFSALQYDERREAVVFALADTTDRGDERLGLTLDEVDALDLGEILCQKFHPLEVPAYNEDYVLDCAVVHMLVMHDAVYWRAWPTYETGCHTSESIPISFFEEAPSVGENDGKDRCPHGMFYTGAGACPACEGSNT